MTISRHETVETVESYCCEDSFIGTSRMKYSENMRVIVHETIRLKM